MLKIKIYAIIVLAVLITVGILTTYQSGNSDAATSDMGKKDDPNSASTMMFLKIAGVDGESQEKDHKGWSEILSFNQAINNPPVEGRSGRRLGQADFDDFVVVKSLDKSSPKIAESICKGKVFPKVEIHVSEYYTDAGRVTYYKYELTNVMVTSYSVGGSGDDEVVPMEEFSLNFEEIKVTYTETDNKGKSKGNVEYTWKVEEGES